MERRRASVGATRPWKESVVDGVRLAYDDAGTGPPLLCLHAIGHGARDFGDLRAALGGRYRVLALDWPGQGNSGDDPVPASAGRYAELLSGFVESLGIPELVVLGNSIGGAAAVRFAVAAPRRVRGLVLVNPGGLDRVDRTARLVTGAMTRFFRAGARRAWWYPTLFALYYRAVLPEAAARAQRDRIVASAFEIAPVLTQAWSSFGRPDADTRELATALRCLVFVAWAKKDRIIQLRRNRPTIDRIPNVRFEEFPAGHAPFLECPDRFRASLEAFLVEVWAPGGARGDSHLRASA